VLSVAFIAAGNQLVAPANATGLERLAFSIAAFLIALLVALGAAYSWALFRAPYEQRNGVRIMVNAAVERDEALAQRKRRLLNERELTQETLYIWELLDDPPHSKPVVVNRVLTECQIKGPGMVAFLGKGTVLNNRLGEGDIESVLHEMVNPGEKQGIIAFLNCDIVRCQFHGIGFFGPKELLDKFRENTTGV